HRVHDLGVAHLDVRRAVAPVGPARERVVVGQVPHGLRRERALVDPGAADAIPLDEQHVLAEIMGAHRRGVAGRPGAENAYIEPRGGHLDPPPGRAPGMPPELTPTHRGRSMTRSTPRRPSARMNVMKPRVTWFGAWNS